MNIHAILEFLDENNLRLHDALAEDTELLGQLHKNVSWMLPQWMTGSHNEKEHRRLVQEFEQKCNTGWGLFYQHPELQVKLLATIGRGSPVRHKFFRPTAKRISATPNLLDLLSKEIEGFRDEDIPLWCRDTNDADLNQLMDDWGVPLEDRTKIRNDFQKGKEQCQI